MNKFEKTNAAFEAAIAECRDIFQKKLHDYGASWRILRPSSLTDQLFIKAKRIRSLEIKKALPPLAFDHDEIMADAMELFNQIQKSK